MRTMIGSDWSPTRKGLGRQTLPGGVGVGVLPEHFGVSELAAWASLPHINSVPSHNSRLYQFPSHESLKLVT